MIDSSLTRNVAAELAEKLNFTGHQLVLAESCTGGLVSAVLTEVSGISRYLCGSFVTYQDESKIDWLGVDAGLIQQSTSVSLAVTSFMARAALERTSRATLSLAVTGHLEPPDSSQSAHSFAVVCCRTESGIVEAGARRFQLTTHGRVNRQWEAARYALQLGLEFI